MLSSQSTYESRSLSSNSTTILDSLVSGHTLNINSMRSLTYASILVADLLAFFAAVLAASVMRYQFGGHFNPSNYISFGPSLIIIYFCVFAIAGLYPGIALNPIEEFQRVLRSASIGFLLLIGASFFLKQVIPISRVILVLSWTFTVLLVPVFRHLIREWCSGREWWGIPTVIIGEQQTAKMTLQRLQRNPALGLKPVAILYDDYEINFCEINDETGPGQVFLGDLSHSGIFARSYRSCYAILAMPMSRSDRFAVLLEDHAQHYNRVLLVPDCFGVTSLSVNAKDICGVLVLEVAQQLTRVLPRKFKRSLDLFLCMLAIVVLAPIILSLYILVRLTSKGSAFYGQRRIGRGGKEFTVWKFRSMLMNAEYILEKHLELNPALKIEWEADHKLRKDPRVTSIGRFLRKTSLDELPQLWNVICGEMSLVGPRPIVQAEVQKYGKSFRQYCQVTPGITGLWQISGRNNTTYELRTQIDEYYVRNWSASLDIYILARTLKTVLQGEGAY